MVVTQNLAEKINPADHNPAEKPEQKREKHIKRQIQIPRGQYLVFTGLVLAAFITGSLIAYYYAQIFSMGYKMNCIEKELSEIEADSENLDVEISKLASLARVEVMATRKLGMVEPGRDIVMVDADLTKENVALEAENSELALEDINVNNGDPSLKKEGASMEEKNWIIQALTQLVSYWQQVKAA